MKTEISMTKLASLSWELLSVALCSISLGAGIAFLLANFALSGMDTEEIITWSHAAGFQGTWIGLLCGLVLYYGVFRRKVEFSAVSQIAGVSLLVGAPCGVLLQKLTGNQAGWLSLLFAPIVALLVAIRIKKRAKA